VKLICELVIAFSSISSNIYAQLETSFWVTTGGQLLNVSTFPPKIVGGNNQGQWWNSVADEKGKLLFYTDGASVFNQNNQLIGTSGLERTYINVCIVPYPGRAKTYNAFFIGWINNDRRKAAYLFRTIIDLTKTGNVASPRKIVSSIGSNNTNFRVIASRASNCQSYWVVATNGDTLKSYLVDRTGVRLPSVNTKIGGAFSLGILKIAPDGTKAGLIEGFNNGTLLDLLNFDKSTGKFQVLIKSQLKNDIRIFYDLEFSPNSKNLFVTQDSSWSDPDPRIGVRSNREILVYKSESINLSELTSSERIVFSKKNQVGFTNGIQLNLTGRIYQVFTSGWGNTGISSINNPNAEKSEDMDFQETIPGVFLFMAAPIFPSYYFEDALIKPSPPIQINAGNDSLLCRGFNITLGKSLPTKYSYEWSSTGILTNASDRTPVLMASQTPNNKYDTITNIVYAYDSSCRKAIDTVKIFYKPAGLNKIYGSKSVCPGVKEISYWIRGDSLLRDNISWVITGGDLSKNYKDSISVNWKGSNFLAQVNATVQNKYNCPDIVAPFFVKVFKSLDTEKPNGVDTLLCKKSQYEYQIQSTNNSNYTWKSIHGNIINGNGTSKILVDWDLNKKYGKLWIEESVNTSLETCFGRSDTLTTVNPIMFGGENINLYSVSSVLENDETLLLNYKVANAKLYQRYSELYWRPSIKNSWSDPLQLDNLRISKSFAIEKVDQEYIFQINLKNICEKPSSSKENSNIFLHIKKDSVNEKLTLYWNKPLGWEQVSSFALYRQKDEETRFTLYDSLPGNLPFKEIANTLDGFSFKYYVIAYSDKVPFPSISNSVKVSFSHEPFIPNVFTPNGDSFNEYFEIQKIELYPENHLSIYNRYGALVYERNNYDNDWGGGGLSNGIYYYHFTTKKSNRSFVGWVQLVR
jgi:gliding motility-associated-like protein